jgi:two-component system cell cycle response regulator
MPDTDAAVAEKVAERIRARIADAPFTIGPDGRTIPVTVSVGVSTMMRDKDTAEAMLKRADLALYEAKNGGRNRVVAAAA